jgi:hypothetical protein
MNYLALSEAYDSQADLLMSLVPDRNDLKYQTCVSTVLELREKAEDLRQAAAKLEDEATQRVFERMLRAEYLELERRAVAAREHLAQAMSKQVVVYERLAEVMTNAPVMKATPQ